MPKRIGLAKPKRIGRAKMYGGGVEIIIKTQQQLQGYLEVLDFLSDKLYEKLREAFDRPNFYRGLSKEYKEIYDRIEETMDEIDEFERSKGNVHSSEYLYNTAFDYVITSETLNEQYADELKRSFDQQTPVDKPDAESVLNHLLLNIRELPPYPIYYPDIEPVSPDLLIPSDIETFPSQEVQTDKIDTLNKEIQTDKKFNIDDTTLSEAVKELNAKLNAINNQIAYLPNLRGKDKALKELLDYKRWVEGQKNELYNVIQQYTADRGSFFKNRVAEKRYAYWGMGMSMGEDSHKHGRSTKGRNVHEGAYPRWGQAL